MERASRVLTKLQLASQNVSPEQLATAAWPVAAGKTIANRTTVIGLIRDRLVIQVEDAIWQRQLWALRESILRNLDKALGQKPPVVLELEFRIAGPTRKPAASAPVSQSKDGERHERDDADDIRDPYLRRIYKAARRKATA